MNFRTLPFVSHIQVDFIESSSFLRVMTLLCSFFRTISFLYIFFNKILYPRNPLETLSNDDPFYSLILKPLIYHLFYYYYSPYNFLEILFSLIYSFLHPLWMVFKFFLLVPFFLSLLSFLWYLFWRFEETVWLFSST